MILDARGNVRYRGGFDSDKNRLTENPEPYLRDALDALSRAASPDATR